MEKKLPFEEAKSLKSRQNRLMMGIMTTALSIYYLKTTCRKEK
jgi:hypothetical protein